MGRILTGGERGKRILLGYDGVRLHHILGKINSIWKLKLRMHFNTNGQGR